jgi:hypothetical protein
VANETRLSALQGHCCFKRVYVYMCYPCVNPVSRGRFVFFCKLFICVRALSFMPVRFVFAQYGGVLETGWRAV